MFRIRAAVVLAACLLWLSQGSAWATTIDFEAFNSLDVLTTQIPGLTFSNAQVLTAGDSLNEFDFPPHSGTDVIDDNGGPMSIAFATPVSTFSAFVTYVTPVTLSAFGAGNVLLGSATSVFSINIPSSGNPPNELLQVAFAGGISSVQISGGALGGSFVLDDATFTPVPAGVPEPASLTLLCLGLAGMGARRWRQRKA